VYSRIINGEKHTFGVSGKLIRNVLVMYDRETETLWSQLLGEAVQGELVGTRLEYLPAVMTTWEQWREMHPNTLVLDKGYAGSRDPYSSYYESNAAGVIGNTISDDRLETKEFVIGVEVGGEAVAFPFSVMNESPVVNEAIGGVGVVAVFDRETGAGAVWERMLADGTVLTFDQEEGIIIRDLESGSLWNGLSGQAIEGAYEGQTLTRVKSTQSFWFGWVDFHPETRLYGLD
jgi:hypothetical protein